MFDVVHHRVSQPLIELLSRGQLVALESLNGRSFDYPWMLADALAEDEPQWRFVENHTVKKIHNRELKQHLNHVLGVFSVHEEESSEPGEGEQDTRKASPESGAIAERNGYLGDCRKQRYRMAQDFGSPSRNGSGCIVERCARCRDTEGGRKDKPGGIFVDRNRLRPLPIRPPIRGDGR